MYSKILVLLLQKNTYLSHVGIGRRSGQILWSHLSDLLIPSDCIFNWSTLWKLLALLFMGFALPLLSVQSKLNTTYNHIRLWHMYIYTYSKHDCTHDQADMRPTVHWLPMFIPKSYSMLLWKPLLILLILPKTAIAVI
jgi:hypothetical protein